MTGRLLKSAEALIGQTNIAGLARLSRTKG